MLPNNQSISDLSTNNPVERHPSSVRDNSLDISPYLAPNVNHDETTMLPPLEPIRGNGVKPVEFLASVSDDSQTSLIPAKEIGPNVTHPVAILEHKIFDSNGEIPKSDIPIAVSFQCDQNLALNIPNEKTHLDKQRTLSDFWRAEQIPSSSTVEQKLHRCTNSLARENKKTNGNNPSKVNNGNSHIMNGASQSIEIFASRKLKERVREIFSGKEYLTQPHFAPVTKACDLPRYISVAFFTKIDELGEVCGQVTCDEFERAWNHLNEISIDETSLVFNILKSEDGQYLIPDDFSLVLEDIVLNHPGLEFLASNNVFQERYMETVISRLFYEFNRNWSNKMSIKEFRRMDFPSMLRKLETKMDMSHTHDCFSYKHFYVIYCNFWELDTNHDLRINEKELASYGSEALSGRIVTRIINGWGKVSDLPSEEELAEDPQMSYRDFIWFFMSEIDKTTPTAIEYWFRCLDLDGDGVLSAYELDYFFEEQACRMKILRMDLIRFEDCICQMFDMIKPAKEGVITLRDLKKCPQNAAPFFDMFFNLSKFSHYDHQQLQSRIRQQLLFEENGQETIGIAFENMSEFDNYAEMEYHNLVVADQQNRRRLEQQLLEQSLLKDNRAASKFEASRKHTLFGTEDYDESSDESEEFEDDAYEDI
ncbi:hypothetical protein G9A89_015268 [Geosiphon pyriformis]|nr:hypothetical protein G9A89_015268 [Geosiphon pyriformis]